MSFDVFLVRFNNGEEAELDAERARSVLMAHQFEDYGDGRFNVIFPDGSHVEFSGEGIMGDEKPKCWAFYIRNMTEAVIGFVFEIAQASGAVMVATMKEAPSILLCENQQRHLPAVLSEKVVVCQSPEALRQLFAADFQEWVRFRNYVISKSRDTKP